MSDNRAHLERLLRYERGGGDAAERRAVAEWLRGDAAARRDLAWIEALRVASDATLEAGDAGDAVAPEELVALVEGTLDEERAAAVRTALAQSAEGLDLLATVVAEARAAATEAAPRPRPIRPAPAPPAPRTWLPWVTMAAAAAILLLLFGPRGHEVPSVIARCDPVPVTTLRGDADDPLERGRAAYGRSAWAEAEALLREAVDQDPDRGEAWLYLGSSLLLLGDRDAEANTCFQAAADHLEGSLADEARWQWAQTRILAGDLDFARGLLGELSGAGGHRDADATALLGTFPGTSAD